MLRLKGKSHHLEDVSETLHTDTDGTVPQIAIFCFFNRIIVAVNDFVKVTSNNSGDFDKSLEVKSEVVAIKESRKRN